jgi:creatinine amidohydrolase
MGTYSTPAPRRFAELRATDVHARCSPDAVFVQPIASIEQHGPHLPFATDLLVCEAVTEAVVNQRGDELDLWLLPPLAYGKSNEHAWAAGTIWLSATTLLAVLDDLGRSVAATPIRRLAFVNGHGGNTSLLDVACRDLRLKYGLMTFLVHPSLPPDHGGRGKPAELGMGVHAGLQETSLVCYLRPDLVDMSAARANVPTWQQRYTRVGFGKPTRAAWLANDFGPEGVIGDPTGATAELGAQIFQGLVESLAETLAEVARFEFETASVSAGLPPG